MNCRDLRDRLVRNAPRPDDAAHLEGCPACRRFASRLAAVRDGLRSRHADVAPDAAFVARVRARLDADATGDALGRAALRLLPVSLALLAVLVWATLDAGSATTGEDAWISPVDDTLQWVVDGGERP